MGRKLIDLTGQRFGKLVVLEEAERRGNDRYWKCKCECGNEKEVHQSNLRRNKTKSCGCSQKSGSTIDLTGQRFGKWTVIGDVVRRDKHRNVYLSCICDCGKSGAVTPGKLKSGISTSCGCAPYNIKDRVGQKFGRWTVLERVEKNKQSRATWKCVCECGTVRYISSHSLDKGTPCLECPAFDAVGKKFGRWTVVSYSGTFENNGRMVSCKCDCGNVKDVLLTSIKSGKSKSCGCLRIEVLSKRCGKLSPNYNVNISDKVRKERRYGLYNTLGRKFRELVRQMDGCSCQTCGGPYDLNVHHLNGWNAFPEQRFDTANGITLCEDCHKEFHYFNGYGDNTLEQFRDHLTCLVGEEHISEIEETLLSRESEIIGQEQEETRELQVT